MTKPETKRTGNNSQLEMKDSQGNWTVIDLDCPKCESNDNVYCADDSETCYCVRCGLEFNGYDALSEQEKKLKSSNHLPPELEAELSKQLADAILDGNIERQKEIEKKIGGIDTGVNKLELAKPDANKAPTHNSKGCESIGHYNYKTCFHPPQQIISAENWGVWAGKKEDVKHRVNDFDLVINLANYGPLKQTHVIPIDELKEFESWDTFKEIQLDWPDYGTISLPRRFWEKLMAYIERNRYKTLVFCQGGHGRTGTAVACMMVVALDWTAEQAINWVRKNYCYSAIETTDQRSYVEAIYEAGVLQERNTETKPDTAQDTQKQLAQAQQMGLYI